MKLFFTILLGAAISFISCKKDRVCSCTLTKHGTTTTTAALTFSVPIVGNVPLIDTSFTTPITEVQTYDRTLMDVNKRTAKQNCVSYKEPYSETITNSAPPLLLTTKSQGENVYKCELK
jgi:hypothetical protein